MYPRLFELGPITVYTYGVLLAAAYLLGLQFALFEEKVYQIWFDSPRRPPGLAEVRAHGHQGH